MVLQALKRQVTLVRKSEKAVLFTIVMEKRLLMRKCFGAFKTQLLQQYQVRDFQARHSLYLQRSVIHTLATKSKKKRLIRAIEENADQKLTYKVFSSWF
jgi:hypothetical protein